MLDFTGLIVGLAKIMSPISNRAHYHFLLTALRVGRSQRSLFFAIA